MPRTPDDLVTALSKNKYACPICKEQAWGVPESMTRTQIEDEEHTSLPLLRALCFSCGFLGWFQAGIPEDSGRPQE